MRKKSYSIDKTSGADTFDGREPGMGEAAPDAAGSAAGTAEPASSITDQQPQPLEEKMKTVQDRYLRLAAEFENYKKRAQRDQVEYTKYATERLLRELVPGSDNLQRELQHAQQSGGTDGLSEGAELPCEQFLEALAGCGDSAVRSGG